VQGLKISGDYGGNARNFWRLSAVEAFNYPAILTCMETGIQLLMRDGAIAIWFRPRLRAEQYAELMRLTDESTTRAELPSAVEQAAKRWGHQVEIEDIGL